MWSPGMTLEYVEKVTILAAVKFYNGNKTQTAGALGISVRSLHDKLEKYDAERRDEDAIRAKYKSDQEEFLKRSRGLHRTTSGVLLESSTPARAEHAVSLPKRKEVQEVLPNAVRRGRTRSAGERTP